MYSASGLRGEWARNLTLTSLIKLEAEYKDLTYNGSYGKLYNGGTASLYGTFWQALPYQLTIFGGFDVTDRDAREEAESYFQKGLRFGMAKGLDSGVSAVLFASWRTRQFNAYSKLLESRRHEDEYNYTFIVRAPRLAVYDFVPSLTVKFNEVKSNVSWLYSYERSSVSIKLEKQF